ncbi:MULTISPECIES: restriction endonuclease subunit S [Aeromonas]|uniref:restriction endonuclease subunit S n=1 Tax=Aeromonas veronii TaxID=654 RepID=UPI0030069432
MVPNGWKKTHLKCVISGAIKNGYSPLPASTTTGYWVLSLGALTDHGINPLEIKPVVVDEKVKQALLSDGDFLISRSNTPDKVGRSIRFKNEVQNCSYPDLMMRFCVDTKKADPNFIEIKLKSTEVRQYYKSCAAGSSSSMVKINKAVVENTPLLLPSFPEQKKIAQVLSTWDRAISTTEQLLANSQQQKKALMQQLLTGKKRLLDNNGVRFSGEWSFITFDDMFKVNNKKSAQVKSSDYLEAGAVPVVDQGKQLIVGYCNNKEIYTDIPVIVFGDHTRCLKWVDFEFCPGADGTQVLDTKAGIDKKFGYYSLCFTDIPNLGYSRHMRELKEKDFKVPLDAKEQQKIAAVLSTADQEITTLQQKLDALKQEKKALMQQLLTGKRRVLVS